MPDQIDEKTLTVDQLAQLNEVEDRRRRYESENKQLEREIAAKESEKKALLVESFEEREIVKLRGATGLKFYPERAALHKLMDEFVVAPDANGNVTCTRKNGEPISYGDALTEFAITHPFCVEEWGSVRAETKQIECRDDFRDTRERVRFINRFGLKRFEELPMHKPKEVPSIDQMSAAEFRALPLSEKSRIVEVYGKEAVALIMQRR